MNKKSKIIILIVAVLFAVSLITVSGLVNAKPEETVYSFSEGELSKLRSVANEDYNSWIKWRESLNEDITLASGTILQPYTVEEFIQTWDVIAIGEFVGTGSIVGMGNGMIELPGTAPFDSTAYYVETYYRLERVYKGEEARLRSNAKYINSEEAFYGDDSIIKVREYIGFGENADIEALIKKDGKYLLAFPVDNNDIVYLDYLYSLNPVDDKGNITWNTKVMSESSKMDGVTNLDRFSEYMKALHN